MAIVTLAEAQAQLPDLVHNLTPGEELLITENSQPVAKLVGQRPVAAQRPKPGLCQGIIAIAADDDEHLKGFAEYMP